MLAGYRARVFFGPIVSFAAIQAAGTLAGQIITAFMVDEYELDEDIDALDVTNSEGVAGEDGRTARADDVAAFLGRPRIWQSKLESPPGAMFRLQQVTYDEVFPYTIAPYSLTIGTYTTWVLQPDRENLGSFYFGVGLIKKIRHAGRVKDKQPVNIEMENDGVVIWAGP